MEFTTMETTERKLDELLDACRDLQAAMQYWEGPHGVYCSVTESAADDFTNVVERIRNAVMVDGLGVHSLRGTR